MKPSEFEERYARYLAGEMDEAERDAFEREVAAEPGLSEEVYADLGVQSAMQRGRVVRGPRHWWRWAAPLAAAAIIILGINLVQSPTEPTGPVMRGEANGVELLAPIGSVATVPTQFEWNPVVGATRYRIELMNDQAEVVRRAVLTGTVAMFPTEVPERGAWRIVALNDLGEELASSAPVRFDVVR